jgi:hypothetical protein
MHRSFSFNFFPPSFLSSAAADQSKKASTTDFKSIVTLYNRMGLTISWTNEFVQSHFLDGVLILRYINKMGTNGGGGLVV